MKVAELPCFQRVQWRPHRGELQRFAVSMLVGFFVLGLAAALRRHHVGRPTFVLWSIGGALALGSLVPGVRRALYLGVNLASNLVGYVVSHVVLMMTFYIVFVPLGLMLRLLGKDLLRLQRRCGRSLWVCCRDSRGPDSYYRPF